MAGIQPCKFYRSGGCKNGSSCSFAHADCTYFARGNCNKGADCLFRHASNSVRCRSFWQNSADIASRRKTRLASLSQPVAANRAPRCIINQQELFEKHQSLRQLEHRPRIQQSLLCFVRSLVVLVVHWRALLQRRYSFGICKTAQFQEALMASMLFSSCKLQCNQSARACTAMLFALMQCRGRQILDFQCYCDVKEIPENVSSSLHRANVRLVHLPDRCAFLFPLVQLSSLTQQASSG